MASIAAAANPDLGKSAVAFVIRELQLKFSTRVVTNLAVREQHGNTVTWVKAEPPDAVAFPDSTQEVSDIVKLCAARRVPVIAFGTGTSLEGHVNAPLGGICLDLSQMKRVIAVHAEDLDCVIEPGITRKELNEHLRDQGLFFPIDPGADASIGGMVATRASGTNAVRYGTMKDCVLALTVVLPSGDVVKTAQRAKKSSAGYDLTHLFIGAEGTLGIITEITLRLHGIPEAISAGVCQFPSVKAACDAVIATIQTGIPVARIELLDQMQVRAESVFEARPAREPDAPIGVPRLGCERAGASGPLWRDRGRSRLREIRMGDQARGSNEALAGTARCALVGACSASGGEQHFHRRLRADLASCRVRRGDTTRHNGDGPARADCRPRRRRQLSLPAAGRHQ